MSQDSFIIIGQYHGMSFMSKLIKWRTWSKISHSAILSQDEKFVYEAWRKGLTKTAWENSHHKKNTRVDLYKVYCTPEEAKKAYEYYESQMGRKYDFKAIIGFILRVKWGKISDLICSELVYKGTLHFKDQLLDRIDPFKVSPGHIDISPRLTPYKTVLTP